MTPTTSRPAWSRSPPQGFDGAAGNVTFENRDARVPGVLVEWRDGKENVIQP